MTNDPVTELYERWRAGDEEAASDLFHLYSEKLVALADRRLNALVKRRVEGQDVVQSVFRTFFRRSAEGQFSIRTSDDIWKLLVTITVRKSQSQARKNVSAKRNVAAEAHGEDAVDAVPAREPGPAEAAIVVDLIEALLEDDSPRDGEILGLRLAGFGRTEIAERLGVSRQTVYRALSKLQLKLEQTLQQSD